LRTKKLVYRYTYSIADLTLKEAKSSKLFSIKELASGDLTA